MIDRQVGREGNVETNFDLPFPSSAFAYRMRIRIRIRIRIFYAQTNPAGVFFSTKTSVLARRNYYLLYREVEKVKNSTWWTVFYELENI